MSHKAMIKYFCVLFSILFLLIRVSNVEGKTRKCSCGTTEYSAKTRMVFDGEPVNDMKKYPFVVSIHEKSLDLPWGICGGALISERFVITVAHCLVRDNKSAECNFKADASCFLPPNSFQVGFPGRDTKKPAKKVDVLALYTHSQYVFAKAIHDVAILKLKRPVKCSAYTQTICLSKDELVEIGDNVTIAGFGLANPFHRAGSGVLLEGTVRRIEGEYCRAHKLECVMCMVAVTKEQTCSGDSGTAQFILHKGRYFAVSLTVGKSADFHCCSPLHPGIALKISSYYGLIRKYVKNLEKP